MLRLVSLLLLIIAAPCALAESIQPPQDNPEEPRFVLNESTKRMLDRSRTTIEADADGRVRVNANGGHRHVYMARIGNDGKIETYCASTAHAAEQFLSGRNLREEPK